MANQFQPVFLIYLNRSGSTYLAKRLDEYSNIEVTPETYLKDNIYLWGFSIKNNKELNNYLDEFYLYDKNKSWNIDREKLTQELIRNKFPISFETFLETLWRLYLQKTPQILIYKSSYIFFVDKIKKKFPEAKFIFILRDLRGIYRSQKTTFHPIRKIPMAETPIETAYKFRKAIKTINIYQDKEWFYWLKYEDFISNSEGEIEDILEFLSIKESAKKSNTNYLEKMASSQKKIHPNLDKAPIKGRINAWKNELSKAELFYLYKIAGKAMKQANYGFEKPKLKFKDFIEIIKIAGKYLFSVHGKIDIIRIALRGDV